MLRPSRLPLVPLIVAREAIAATAGPRVPEPMVMDEPEGVAAYDQAGTRLQVPLHHVNALAISRLLPPGGTLIDLGTGSGRLLARLARGRPDARLVGLDLSEPMLETGRRLLAAEGLSGRVELRRGDITTFDEDLPESLDAVSCNLTLHQLPSKELVMQTLEALARARRRTRCAVHIFDLVRLRNPRSWPAMLSLLDVDDDSAFRHDALASERAAFTVAELTELLRDAGLGDLEHMRARPLGEYQVHRAAGRAGSAPGAGLWRDVRMPPGTRLATRIVRSSFPRALTRA
jgi:SAM-dependent methyltransferase